MANNYWIKLYIEILDDPKMGRLTAEQWRLTIELFLLAGEQNAQGILPTISDIAWRLRMDENELLETMGELRQVGILSQDGDAWIVTNFARRQDKISDAERSKAWRERTHKKQYYGQDNNEVEYQGTTDKPKNCNESDTTRIADTDIDIESDTDKELTAAVAEIAKIYESEIGVLTPFVRENILDALDRYPRDWIIEAIKEATKHNAKSWSYAEAVLSGWRTNGYKVDTRSKNTDKSKNDLSDWRNLRLQYQRSENEK